MFTSKTHFYNPIQTVCVRQLLPDVQSVPEIPEHATFRAVLTSDGGVRETWQNWEVLRPIWGRRKAEN